MQFCFMENVNKVVKIVCTPYQIDHITKINPVISHFRCRDIGKFRLHNEIFTKQDQVRII